MGVVCSAGVDVAVDVVAGAVVVADVVVVASLEATCGVELAFVFVTPVPEPELEDCGVTWLLIVDCPSFVLVATLFCSG